MDKKLVVQTLLTALSTFEQLLTANRKAVKHKAEHSYASSRTCLEISNELIDRIYENDCLHNLRVHLEQLLLLSPERDRKLLILKYVHDLPANRVAEMMNMSERSVFRHLNTATERFASRLESVGVTTDFYKNLLGNHLMLRNIHLRLKASISKNS